MKKIFLFSILIFSLNLFCGQKGNTHSERPKQKKRPIDPWLSEKEKEEERRERNRLASVNVRLQEKIQRNNLVSEVEGLSRQLEILKSDIANLNGEVYKPSVIRIQKPKRNPPAMQIKRNPGLTIAQKKAIRKQRNIEAAAKSRERVKEQEEALLKEKESLKKRIEALTVEKQALEQQRFVLEGAAATAAAYVMPSIDRELEDVDLSVEGGSEEYDELEALSFQTEVDEMLPSATGCAFQQPQASLLTQEFDPLMAQDSFDPALAALYHQGPVATGQYDPLEELSSAPTHNVSESLQSAASAYDPLLSAPDELCARWAAYRQEQVAGLGDGGL